MTNFQQQATLPPGQIFEYQGQIYYIPVNQPIIRPPVSTQSPAQTPPQLQALPQSVEIQQRPQQQLQQLQLTARPEPEPSIDPGASFSFGNGQLQVRQQSVQTIQKSLETKTNNRLKNKAKNIRGQFISHYIDSQLIIETPEPLRLKKNKKKKMLSQQQNQANLQVHNPILAQPPPQQVALPNNNQQNVRLINTIEKQQQPQQQAQPTASISPEVNTKDSDILRLRELMKTWSVADVVNFIESHDDIRAYSFKFVEDEIDGTALLYMIDRNLNIQVLSTMFKYGPAMKIEAALSKYKLNQ